MIGIPNAAGYGSPGRRIGLPAADAFARLWVADTVSKLGDAISVLALPLTAIIVLDAGPFELGLLGAAGFVPMVFAALPAGAIVDRHSRRPVMVATDLARAALLASIPLAYVAGQLSMLQLCVVAAANAVAISFADPAATAILPNIVERSRLLEANARVETARAGVQVVGPGLGGLLISTLGAPLALLADALSFVGSAVALRGIREADPVTNGRRRSLSGEIVEGLRFIQREHRVAATVATATINNLSRTVGLTILLILLSTEARASPAEIGLAFALGNTGFLVGATSASHLSRRLGMGRAMLAGVSCFGPGMIAVAVAPVSLSLAAVTVMLFLNGFGIALHNVNQVTVRQTLTPDALRARVGATTRMAILGAMPLGAMIGGLAGATIGVRETIWLAAVGLIAGVIPYVLIRVWRIRSVDDLRTSP